MLDLSSRRLSGSPDSAELLLVGPSLGTAVATLWARTAARLRGVEVLGWDLPGHGASAPAGAPFNVLDLADAVEALREATGRGRPVHYAGVSLGGAVGLTLAAWSSTLASVTTLCSAPTIGEPRAWQDRAELVRQRGTASVVDGSRQRWFGPGFVEREPGVVDVLLDGLRATHADSYALACEALASFDLSERHRRGEPTVPLLAVTGAHDVVVTSAQVREALPHAEHVELPDCGHLPPAEQPAAVAVLLTPWIARIGGTR